MNGPNRQRRAQEPPSSHRGRAARSHPTYRSSKRPAEAEPGPRDFASFGVSAPIVTALAEAGITAPFPIQALTLPIALEGTDVIGQARTGTGKTLAFGIPVLERVTAGRAAEPEGLPPARSCRRPHS